jgi:hypothetical protein
MTWGCDFGSRRLALFDLEDGVGHVLRLPKLRRGEWEDRPSALRRQALWVAEVVPPDEKLWLESAISGRQAGNLDTAIKMAQTNGAVCAAHTLTYLVAQSTWKKGVVGDGHADKDAVTAWLTEHHPAIATACQTDQDLVDAACIALFGRAVAEGRVETPRQLSESRHAAVLRSRQRANAKGPGQRRAKSVP